MSSWTKHRAAYRAALSLANLIKILEVQQNPYFNKDDPWSGFIMEAAFAMCSMDHTTLKVMPGQLVSRHMMLNIQHEADWAAIKAQKQELIQMNN